MSGHVYLEGVRPAQIQWVLTGKFTLSLGAIFAGSVIATGIVEFQTLAALHGAIYTHL